MCSTSWATGRIWLQNNTKPDNFENKINIISYDLDFDYKSGKTLTQYLAKYEQEFKTIKLKVIL